MEITYNSFLSEKTSLSFEGSQKIHQAILSTLEHDQEVLQVWQDFLEASMEYAYTRSRWLLLEREERQENDSKRTTQHDKVIYILKLLSRYLEQAGQDIQWFKDIEADRKLIGDFASYIAYIYAVNAR